MGVNRDKILKKLPIGSKVLVNDTYVGTIIEVGELGLVQVEIPVLNKSCWHGPSELKVIK